MIARFSVMEGVLMVVVITFPRS